MTALFWVPYVLNRIAVSGAWRRACRRLAGQRRTAFALGAARHQGASATRRESRDLRADRAHRACAQHLERRHQGRGRGLLLRPAAALRGLFGRRSRRRARSPLPPAGWRRSPSSPASCAGSDGHGPPDQTQLAAHRRRRRSRRRNRRDLRPGGPRCRRSSPARDRSSGASRRVASNRRGGSYVHLACDLTPAGRGRRRDRAVCRTRSTCSFTTRMLLD